jgi:hypothetical protein
MKPIFSLILAILMAIFATLSIFTGMAVLECTRTNFILITAVSTMGYLTAFLLYDVYKTETNGARKKSENM